MPWRAVLVDDEELASRRLGRLLRDHRAIEVVGTASSGREAVEIVDREKPDLLFLDIQMPGMDGFAVLRAVTHMPTVIFVTAYDEYALRAFEENSVDYLLKPVSKDRLDAALQKLDRLERRSPTEGGDAMGRLERIAARIEVFAGASAATQRLTVKLGDRTLVLDLAGIAAFVADNKVTLALVGDHEYPVDYTLDELETRLGARRFFRTHRSSLVNLDAVREIHAWFGGRLKLSLKYGKREITVSRNRVRALQDSLSI